MSVFFKDHLACVVILYHPKKEQVISIVNYSRHFNKLYVLDNSENSNAEILNLFSTAANIVVYHDGNNAGIADRLNQACRLAITDGFEWLLTMDQDSAFDEENRWNYELHFEKIDNEKIALIGVEYGTAKVDSREVTVVENQILITSGSILSLAAFKQLGEFESKYFIDEVDSEYCYRAMAKGWRVILLKGVFLTHSLGEISQFRSLKNFSKSSRSLHAPIRVYYSTRNYLDVRNKYIKRFPDYFKKTDGYQLNRLKNNLLYGKNRFAVLKMFWKGRQDYKNGKFGKLNLGQK